MFIIRRFLHQGSLPEAGKIVAATVSASTAFLPPDFADRFYERGLGVVDNFFTREQIEELRQDIGQVVESFDCSEHRCAADTASTPQCDKLLMQSSDSIQYFFEKGALDEKFNLKIDKSRALNKVGHGLHLLRPIFKKNTFTPQAQAIGLALGYNRPIVVESMYMFKQPLFGGEILPHQDAGFLYVNHPNKLFGIWVALDDADTTNGCLWYAPGSHKLGLIDNTRLIRVTDPVTLQTRLKFTGPWPMRNMDRFQFEPVEVKAGSAVILHGLVLHKSDQNLSDKPRNSYSFHIAETYRAKWDVRNWLQPIRGPFLTLY